MYILIKKLTNFFVGHEELGAEASFLLFIEDINKKIKKHSFEIDFVTCEVTGQRYVVWLNTRSDNIGKLQIVFNKAEQEYFQIIMMEIIQSNEKCIPLNVCLNLSGTLVANVLFKIQAQRVLKKWTKGGYLVTVDGKVYLGPRCIHEFSSYFQRQDNVRVCDLCSRVVFVVSFINFE